MSLHNKLAEDTLLLLLTHILHEASFKQEVVNLLKPMDLYKFKYTLLTSSPRKDL